MNSPKRQKPKITMLKVDTFYCDAVCHLIELSRDLQKNTDENYYDSFAYIDECCTVRIKGPRRSGHSTAVNNLARLYDAVIVTPTKHMGDLLFKEWENRCSVHQINNYVRGRRASVVICDGVEELNQEEKALLHSMSHGHDTFVLVYVG